MREGTVPKLSTAVTAAPSPLAPLLTRRLCIIVATQTLFCLGWSVYLILPKFLIVQLHANASAIGYVSAASGFLSVAAVPVVTMLIDRVGRRPLLQVGCATLALASFAFPWVDRIGPLVFLLSAATGVAFVFAYNASATMATDGAAPERLGQVLAIVGAAGALTNSIATMSAEHIAQWVGWRFVFVAAGVMALCALGATLAIRDGREGARAHVEVVATATTRAPVARVLLVAMLMGAIFAAMFEFHQPYALLLGAKAVGPFFAGFTIATVAVRMLFGRAGDRYGHRAIATLAAVGYAAAALATAGLRARWLWAYGAVFGFAHGVFYPTLNALAVELVPARARGRVITLFNGAFRAGFALSMLAWGNVAEHFGYPVLFTVAAILGFASVALLAVRRHREFK
jgi:MFS family permease